MTTTTTSSACRLMVKNLPAFSPVAAKLMTLLRGDQVNFKEAADLIKSDAGFSAEILRLANSSMTGMRYPVSNILQALTVMGLRQVASLATTLTVGKLVKPVARLPIMRQCWRHNLATALIARQRAGRLDIDPEDGYMFGLLAGIGRLALLVSHPQGYMRLADRAEADRIPLDILEADFFGFDHRQAAQWLVAEWRLPAELLKVFRPPEESKLAYLILDANDYADRLGFSIVAVNALESDDPRLFEVAEQVNRIEQDLGI